MLGVPPASAITPLLQLSCHLVLVGGLGLLPCCHQIVLQRRNSTPVEAVKPPGTITLIQDQARLFQNLEMLGNSRAADWHALSQRADGLWTCPQAFKNQATG